MNSKINAAYSDALIRLAVIENHKREMEAIPPRDELERMYSFSPEHEARMKRLFSAKRRVQISPFILARRIAAVILIATTVLFGALLTSPEVRAAIRSVITNIIQHSDHTNFSFDGSDDAAYSEWKPTYIPEGFAEVRNEIIGAYTYIDYKNKDGNILYFQYSGAGGTSISVDNEQREYSIITNDGISYHIFDGGDEKGSTIIWEQDSSVFTISSETDLDELLKMAYSIKKMK